MHRKILTGLYYFLALNCLRAQVLTSTSGNNNHSDSALGVFYKLDELVVEVTSAAHYTEKAHQIFTIYKSSHEGYLHQRYWLNKFTRLKDIRIKVYNSEGAEIKKYGKKDFDLSSAYDGYTIASDDKVMQLTIACREYPCTVDVQYEEEVNGYILLPSSIAVANTELLKYTLKMPRDMQIRYRTINLHIQPSIDTTGNTKTYTWIARDLAVKEHVSNSYESGRFLPGIEIVPASFEYDGYKGEFKTWSDFGKWNYALYKEDKPFSEQRIAEIRSMVDGYTSKQDKIRVLYNYLKKNFRYVSVQLGIGGFKPFPVKFVDQQKYGDCKALTNYMRNLLAVVGINSYPALINAGYNKYPADADFPTDPFNHVILCIPDKKDSIWLECTSSNSMAGFLGSFTENKNALLLTENGGVLVKTPRSFYGNNLVVCHTQVWVNESGAADMSAHFYTTGDIYEHFDYYIAAEEKEKQKEKFNDYFLYKPSEQFNLTDVKDTASGKSFQLNLSYDKGYDFHAGPKYFFPQRMNELCREKLNASESRDVQYIFRYPYEWVDTTDFHLAPGFSIDNIPAPVEIKNENGYYKREIITGRDKNTISVIAHLIVKNSIIPPDQYKNVAEFLATVSQDEGQKIVLKKE